MRRTLLTSPSHRPAWHSLFHPLYPDHLLKHLKLKSASHLSFSVQIYCSPNSPIPTTRPLNVRCSSCRCSKNTHTHTPTYNVQCFHGCYIYIWFIIISIRRIMQSLDIFWLAIVVVTHTFSKHLFLPVSHYKLFSLKMRQITQLGQCFGVWHLRCPRTHTPDTWHSEQLYKEGGSPHMAGRRGGGQIKHRSIVFYMLSMFTS